MFLTTRNETKRTERRRHGGSIGKDPASGGGGGGDNAGRGTARPAEGGLRLRGRAVGTVSEYYCCVNIY